jgi:hypothetical protein
VDAGYKGFYCSALFTFQKGGDVYSFTESIAAYAGTAKCTQDRSTLVVSGELANGSELLAERGIPTTVHLRCIVFEIKRTGHRVQFQQEVIVDDTDTAN